MSFQSLWFLLLPAPCAIAAVLTHVVLSRAAPRLRGFRAMAVGMAASFVANAADVPLVPTHVAPRVAVEREEA